MIVKQFFNQQDARWRDHFLGWGPALGTIGLYGCYDTVCAMIAWACGLHYYPSTFDVLCDARKIFTKDPTGTFDFLPDNALDLAFPGRFKTFTYGGYRGDMIALALKTADYFAYVHVIGYSPFWKMNIATHYVLMHSAKEIVDPEGGVVRTLVDYGGPACVVKTYIVRHLPAIVPAPPVVVVPPPPIKPPVTPPPVITPTPVPVPPAPIVLPTPLPTNAPGRGWCL